MVIWAPRAITDIKEAWDFIAIDNEPAAEPRDGGNSAYWGQSRSVSKSWQARPKARHTRNGCSANTLHSDLSHPSNRC